MPRAKKSAQLLAKLNRSLGAEAEPAAATPAPQPAAPTTARRKASAKKRATLAKATPTPSAKTPPAPVTEPLATVPADAAKGVPQRRHTAEKIVRQQVLLASGAGLIPMPVADLAAVVGLQLKLLADLSHAYGVEFSKGQAKAIVVSLIGSLGGTVLACSALGSMAKFLPGLGSLLSLTTLPVAAGSITYLTGHIIIDHFEAGGTLQNLDLDVAEAAFARRWHDAKTTVQNLR